MRPPPCVTRPRGRYFFLEVERLAVVRRVDLRAVARFLGLRAAVVFFRAVRFRPGLLAAARFRDVVFRLAVAAFILLVIATGVRDATF